MALPPKNLSKLFDHGRQSTLAFGASLLANFLSTIWETHISNGVWRRYNYFILSPTSSSGGGFSKKCSIIYLVHVSSLTLPPSFPLWIVAFLVLWNLKMTYLRTWIDSTNRGNWDFLNWKHFLIISLCKTFLYWIYYLQETLKNIWMVYNFLFFIYFTKS